MYKCILFFQFKCVLKCLLADLLLFAAAMAVMSNSRAGVAGPNCRRHVLQLWKSQRKRTRGSGRVCGALCCCVDSFAVCG